MLRLRTGQSALGYKLQRPLGCGAYGEVWQGIAEDGDTAALKFIALERAKEEERSLKWVAQIRHPHVITLLQAREWRGHLVVVMELADGTLHDCLTAAQDNGESGLPVADLLRYMSEAAHGLDYLNARVHDVDGEKRRIFHRDIKPQNLLLVGNRVKIGDFGLAKAQALTIAPQTGIGTVSFMAPEAFQGKTSLSMDQYSLAVCYYCLRTGELPFAGDSAGEVMHKVLTNPPDLAKLPVTEQAVVAKALAKESTARYADCREFVKELESVATTIANAPRDRVPEGTRAAVLLPTMSCRGPVPLSESDPIVPSSRGDGGAAVQATTSAAECPSRLCSGPVSLPLVGAAPAHAMAPEDLPPPTAMPRSEVDLTTLGPPAPTLPNACKVSGSWRVWALLRHLFSRRWRLRRGWRHKCEIDG